MTHDMVIIGGGAAGIATAASIPKRNAVVSIAIVDPARDHDSQPGWTLVGAGVVAPDRQTMALGNGDTIACHVPIVVPRGVATFAHKLDGKSEREFNRFHLVPPQVSHEIGRAA